MKIDYKEKDEQILGNIEDYASGTIVKYGSADGNDIMPYGIGIILDDCDGCNRIIYDLEDDIYYTDYYNYKVYKVFKGTIVLEK